LRFVESADELSENWKQNSIAGLDERRETLKPARNDLAKQRGVLPGSDFLSLEVRDEAIS
jgi:hypothetical protein